MCKKVRVGLIFGLFLSVPRSLSLTLSHSRLALDVPLIVSKTNLITVETNDLTQAEIETECKARGGQSIGPSSFPGYVGSMVCAYDKIGRAHV